MKISIHIEPQLGYTYNDIVTLAKAAEDSGFYRFTVSDHFFGPVEGHEMQSHDAWTTLALLVPQTKRIRLGTLVTSQSYRNPALLAKIVASLDNASNGRIDLGIGAGWKESEYKAYGYPFPSAKERVTQLMEAIQIINLLWTEERPSFDGDFYRIKETMFLPKPVQKPRVPIWVGSMKLRAPMMEGIVARYADGMDYGAETTIKGFLEKKERVKRMCEEVGRDFEELRWSVSKTAGVIGEDTGDFEERLINIGQWESFLQADKNQLKNLLLDALNTFCGELDSREIVRVDSPVELRVYDSEGLITGVTNGEIKVEIPYSSYNNKTKTATIFSPSESLKYKVVGTDIGTYDIEVISIENGQIINFTASDIPTSPDAIHQYAINWDALSKGEEGVTVLVDSDGDGLVDRVFSSDSDLTGEEFIEKNSHTCPTHTLTITTGENGSTFPIPGMYACSANSTIHVTAIPEEGYTLDYWELDGCNVGSANPYVIFMNETHTLNAFFSYAPQAITANMDFDTDSLNLYSIGRWIIAYIELPEGYNVDDINVSSILLNGTVPVDPYAPLEIGDYNSDGIPDLMIKFNRTMVAKYILPKGISFGNVTLTLSGKLYDDTPFEGSDIIKVSALTGDVNCDGVVDISDLVQAAISYGSKEDDPNWNPNSNFSQSYEIIDISDLVTIASHYGEKHP